MIKSIKIEDVPQEILGYLHEPLPNFVEVYEASGMFDPNNTDYLFVLEIFEEKHYWRCAGYVYNGTAPECSEWGGFGLNTHKTQRIW